MATLTNYATDPSFEVESAAWGGWGSPTLQVWTTDESLFGARSMHVITDATVEGAATLPGEPILGLTGGTPMWMSCYIYGDGAGIWAMTLNEQNSGGSDTAYSGGSVTVTPGANWTTRLIQPVTLNAATARGRIIIHTHGSSPASAEAYLDGVMLTDFDPTDVEFFEGTISTGGGIIMPLYGGRRSRA